MANFLEVGLIPNPNGKPNWKSQEIVIVDHLTNINNGKEYEYRVVYRKFDKDVKEEIIEIKEGK